LHTSEAHVGIFLFHVLQRVKRVDEIKRVVGEDVEPLKGRGLSIQ
jgi:hypothetical protein